ncbi:hypothetical protein [Rhizobium halophilum]|uniref:hypothetical protein n=1 Tax=Rhizobium halophilum TaxID=2846852 RepID=UPI001EFCEECE|nr:hypothetical protein [Rhizobium halophilum]MCF6371119.1 hypothetical protein [Rhizobium halophilum]
MRPLVLSLALLPSLAVAQEAEGQRFQLERTDNGLVRLDRQTGAISLCREDNGTLSCRMAADERAAYEQELDLLEKRVSALEDQLEQGRVSRDLPGEAEIEQSLSIMERFMRRFMAIIEEFTAERDQQEQAPDRT